MDDLTAGLLALIIACKQDCSATYQTCFDKVLAETTKDGPPANFKNCGSVLKICFLLCKDPTTRRSL